MMFATLKKGGTVARSGGSSRQRMSSSSSSAQPAAAMLRVSVEPDGLCKMVLCRPKVNALSPAFLKEIQDTLLKLQDDPQVKGILITSDQRAFSAGLDLKAAAHYTTEEEIVQYIKLIGESLTAPLRLSKPVACGIEGHAIAGGFALAAACDFIALSRTNDYLLGLTELTVGVPFPREVLESVRHCVSNARGLRKFVLEGKTMSPLQAFECGFGDVLVIDPVLAATQWLQHAISLPAGVFEITKRQFHAPYFLAIAHPDSRLTVSQPAAEQRINNVRSMKAAMAAMQGKPHVGAVAAGSKKAARSAL